MTWKKLETYFLQHPSGFINDLFSDSLFPWSPLGKLKTKIELVFSNSKNQGAVAADRTIIFNPDFSLREGAYFFTRTEVLKSDFIDTELCIQIKSGTLLEAGATIKNHTIIEDNCEIRQGAYLRGYAYIGEKSVIGHTTEIKNSILCKHVEAGHFAYIGDSIIGSYVNLGAGTKISNLEFRSLDAKRNEHFPELILQVDGQRIKTGINKFGAIIGDGCETGCNAVLCPLVFLEPKCWIMPNHCVLKGIYKKGSILRQSKK